MQAPNPKAANHSAEAKNRAISSVSVAVTAGLLLLKAIAFGVTGSAALMASMLDSAADLLASSGTWIAIRYAQTPPDKEHPFGHGKAEPFAALLQAFLITASAVGLLLWATQRFLNPLPIEGGYVATGIMLLATAVTIGLVNAQRRVVKETGSLAVQADSMHFVGDIAANLSVIVALISSELLGVYWLDSLVAIALALLVLGAAFGIGHRAFDQLMDHEVELPIREKICQRALTVDGVHGVNSLRVRRAGPDILVEICVSMDAETPLWLAHERAHQVESNIQEAFPRAQVIVHKEPQ